MAIARLGNLRILVSRQVRQAVINHQSQQDHAEELEEPGFSFHSLRSVQNYLRRDFRFRHADCPPSCSLLTAQRICDN